MVLKIRHFYLGMVQRRFGGIILYQVEICSTLKTKICTSAITLCLLISSAVNLCKQFDQIQQNVGPDLEPIYLTL